MKTLTAFAVAFFLGAATHAALVPPRCDYKADCLCGCRHGFACDVDKCKGNK